MTVSQSDVPEPMVEFFEEITGFQAGISGLSIAVSGKWNTNYGIIYDDGWFNLAIFNMDMSSVVQVGSDYAGRLSITSMYCDANIEKAKINFHGGASWIFQLMVESFQGRIKREITERICPAVEHNVAKLEEYLEAMNVAFEVNEALVLEIPLTNSPVMDASSLGLDLKGEFQSCSSKRDPPFMAQPFELHEKEGYMLTMGLSEFTLNSASYGYYSAGLMQALINDSMIPPGSPFHLNTSYFGVLIPQLPKQFPGMLMELQVYAREVPMFSFFPGAIFLDFQGSIKAFALQTNKTLAPLFQLNADSIFNGHFFISAGKLKGSMKMENFTLALISTEVGTFQTAALENFMKTGINMVVMSKVNAKLAKGLALPSMPHGQLVNPVLTLKKGFIAISSDAEVWST
ncbi:bactericidal permeability-increasing protein [Aplochiton taeniatus]